MKKRFLLVAMASLALCLTQSQAWADGESREAAPAEKEFYQRVMQTLARALPPGPEGWDAAREPDLAPLEYVSVGAEDYPMMVSCEIEWVNAGDKEKADQAIQDALAAMMAREDASGFSEEDAARLDELSSRMGAAIEKGDGAEVNRLQAELDILGRKLAEQGQDMENRIDQVVQSLEAHDVECSVHVFVNSVSESFNTVFVEQAPVAGGRCFRSQGEHTSSHGWREGYTWVFLGKGWVLSGEDYDAYMEFEPKPGVPHTRVQNVALRIQGDEARAAGLLRKVDFESLKRLMQ